MDSIETRIKEEQEWQLQNNGIISDYIDPEKMMQIVEDVLIDQWWEYEEKTRYN